MKPLIIILLFFCAQHSFNEYSNQLNLSTDKEKTKLGNEKIIYTISMNQDGTYGYEIIINGITIIKQSVIPAIQGLHPFKFQNEAEKVAGLMVKKLKAGDMPPSITIDEIDSLKINY